ncbi:choice-of-anchor Q domain-containing protein [Dyadobacter pollutisoli]
MSCIAGSQTNALNCLFVGNTTNVPVGGAVHQVNSFGSFKFCTFYNNASSAGVITNENSSFNLESGIIWKNDAGGPAIAHTGTGSADAAFSLIQGGYPGTGNVSTYPQFARAASPAGPDHIFRTADDGLRIVYGSPAMNTGSNQFINTPTDILGAPRVQASEADMGAYEGAACPSYDVIYVDGGIANPGGGDSWATAVKNLSDAIAMSASCGGSKQIWVKKGTYYPSAYPAGCTNCSSARDFTFLLDKNTILYGGFAGNETTLTQRDPIHNITTLSGNIGDMNTDADNSYHVVMILDFSNKSAILDGFAIQDGRADGTGNSLISTPYNTEVGKNTGAGLWLADASPVINQCVFTNNKAASGGGMYIEGSDAKPAVRNCVFSQNQASLSGGGVYNVGGDFSISNTIFTGNSATNRGGGISSPGDFVRLFNTTFYNNTASATGGVNGFYTATNSIFWHSPIGAVFNSTPTYTTVEGGFDGDGNLSDDPQFKDPANLKGPDGFWGTDDDGLKLVTGSSAINSGNNSGVNTTTDLTGADRVQGNTVDRGAYEGGICPNGSRIYVDAAVATSGLGNSWATAYKTLQEALNAASCSNIIEIWVKKGTYYPSQYPEGCTNCGSRDYTFVLKNNLAIYGGFSGSEASINDRNLAANISIASGNIGNAADNNDNSHHVVMSVNCNSSAIFDGFTVEGGQAAFLPSDIYMNLPSLAVPRDVGGGLYNYQSSPTVSSCIFGACHSYATIYNENNASPVFSNTVFANNSLGAAIYNKTNSSPRLTNCLITGNGAAAGNPTGGINNNSNSNPVIKSTTFYGNNYQNGLIYSNNSSPVITGSILWGKSANGMIVNNGGSATVSYSIVEGGFSGTGNINSNPLFVNAVDPDGTDNIFATADDGLILTRSSPAVDADGSGTAPLFDILWTPRPTGMGIDLGVYELNYAPAVPSVTITSSSTNICAAGSITFSSSVVNEGATPGYQWKKNDLPINNATQATYTAGSSDLADGDQITLTLTSSLYASPNPVTSNIITIQTADTLYVDASVAGSGDGNSWATAFKTLAEALDAAHRCAQVETVLIAKGTYTPMSLPYNMGPGQTGTPVVSADNRDKTFHVRNGLDLYGGYPNGGGARNIATNATILDGANVGGVSGEYAYHVVLVDAGGDLGNASDTLKLSGLIIKNGRADGSGVLSVNNYDVERNRGGGVYVANALNLISHNVITQNNAAVGAGIYSFASHNNFYSNVFAENTSIGGGGGGYTKFGETVMANNIATGNTAGSGGGMMIDNGSNVLTNNTFYNNAATTGGGLHSENGTGTYNNNIFRENKTNGSANVAGADYYKNPTASNTFKNNVLQRTSGSYTTDNAAGNFDLGTSAAATGNIFVADPLFTNPLLPAGVDGIYGTADDGLRLAACSPAINTGYNGAVVSIPKDINSNTRVFENTVDMGAYELTATKQSLLPDVNITGNILFCSGSANPLTATAGFNSYLWSDGSTGQSVNAATPGKYIVTATDAAGCMAKDSVVTTHQPASDLSLRNFQLNGGAIVYTANSYWLDYYSNRTSSMWYRDSIDLNYDFELSFRIWLGTATGADAGMAFVLQKAGIYAVGSNPVASLGYYDAKATFGQSVAIELDMNNSGAGPPWYDPAGSHISFVKNGSAMPVSGPFPLSISRGNYIYKFTWNHLTHTLSLYQDGVLLGTMSEDVVNTVFGGRSKVIFGFTTSSNSGNTAQQVDILPSNPYVYDRQLEIKQDCGSATLRTNAAAGSTWLWSDGSTGSTIQAVPGNTYSVTTSYGGCTFTAEKYVDAVTSPVITANGPVTNICPGTPVTLTASSGRRFAWSNDSATQSITVTAPGVYNVLVDGCRSNEIVITHAAGGGLAASGDEVVSNISGNTLLAATGCRAIAFVEPGGSQPLTGSLTAKTWVETAVIYYKGEPYVPRHFEITPAQNAENATARITLYFSQQDFNLFNNDHPAYALPSSENDAVGKAALRIVQYHGNGDNTGLPAGYPVGGSTSIIDPRDGDILWNVDMQRWEVSFEVNGFSGFFVTSSTPLPVSWISFSARRNDASQVVLNWRVNEWAVSHYQIERSLDARNFTPAGILAAQGDGIMEYTFTDPTPVLQQIYYRIRQTDLDGSYSYSRILSVSGIDGEFTAFPNPVGGRLTVQVGKRYIGSRLKLMNISGVVLQEITVKQQSLTLDLDKYASGVYLLSTEDGKVIKLIRQ